MEELGLNAVVSVSGPVSSSWPLEGSLQYFDQSCSSVDKSCSPIDSDAVHAGGSGYVSKACQVTAASVAFEKALALMWAARLDNGMATARWMSML